MHIGGKKEMTLSQQLLFLKSNSVVGGSGEVSCGKLTWTTRVQPTPLARNYTVHLTLKEDETPDVFVDNPSLTELAGDREIPHVYLNPLRLCLYLPGTGEWHGRKRLDQTIIPWTYLWLFYFEDWLATDNWKGGGKHPCEDAAPQGNRDTRRRLARL
jgi:hypothetical protein